ncbi:MAG: hypothetical protein GY842_14140 [bacterium]|nr:hypothetical protein [bacterium]
MAEGLAERLEPIPARLAPRQIDTAAEWRWWLTGLVLGTLVFETVTGLTIYLLAFSVFNQYAVLLHTVVGVLILFPLGWYLGVHWWRRFRGNLNHYQLLGYASAVLLLALAVSGVVLTWQALFSLRISPVWDLIHVIGGLVIIGVLGAHLATLVWRKARNTEAFQAVRRAHRSCLVQSLVWGGGLTVLCAVLAVAYSAPTFESAFSADYSFRYGADRPFAPSLARRDMSAVDGALRAQVLEALNDDAQKAAVAEELRADPIQHVGIVTVAERLCAALDLDAKQRVRIDRALAEARDAYRQHGRIAPQRLAGSRGCGTSGCHSEILEEWLPSAHRYASMDFVFQKVQANMAEELAPEATRYCAGCHDPIALFSGAKNVGNTTLSVEGADEGVSCLVCHAMVQTDVRGNADYTVDPGVRYLYELEEGPWSKQISDFLIRAYPRHHVASYTRPLYKTAEVCGACHKQFIDEELNEVGWVQGQNQYDNWRKSRWHTEGDPARTINCRECHMPLLEGEEPAAGDLHDFNRHAADGKHRSHRFLAANQFVPRHMGLEGAEEQCKLTVDWLRGEYPVPEIADRWTTGPVIRIELGVPEAVRPGQSAAVQTVIVNNKTGHDFPTGPMDMIEGWVELTVTDEHGAVIFASARPDERGYLVNPEVVFKAEPIDRHGQLIGKHELWRKVGARFKRTLFPGFSDTAEFVFECPATPTDPERVAKLSIPETTTVAVPEGFAGRHLRVTAVVWYCKFSAAFLDRLFGPEAGLRSEVTEIARAEAVIPVLHDGLVLNE